MHVIGHHDCGVENIALPIVVQTMLKNDLVGIRRKRLAVQLSECHEDRPVGLLVMRQATVIVVIACQ